MRSRNYRSSIPKSATERIQNRFDNGQKRTAYFYVGRKRVGFREWNQAGHLEFEYGIKDGQKHGREYHFWDGHPYEVTPYRNGIMHGTGKQWDEEGNVVITYTMKDGVGLDLWCGHLNQTLSEEYYVPKDGELGYR